MLSGHIDILKKKLWVSGQKNEPSPKEKYTL